MTIVIDKYTIILFGIGLLLLILLLGNIIQSKTINQQKNLINAYEFAVKDFSQYCDINFDEFIIQEKEKERQELINDLNKESIILNIS